MKWTKNGAGTLLPRASLQRLEVLHAFDLAKQHGLVVTVEIPIDMYTDHRDGFQ